MADEQNGTEEKQPGEKKAEDEEEEDYMSATFIKTSTARTTLKRNAKAPKKMKKGELEKHRLKEGLSRPIDETSKGYELLAKMGFKPGMSLGRPRAEEFSESEHNSIKEPIPIQTPSTSARNGFGYDGGRLRTSFLATCPECSDGKAYFPRVQTGPQRSSTSATCPECLNDKAYFTQVQARTANEQISIFYTCTECLHHWRE